MLIIFSSCGVNNVIPASKRPVVEKTLYEYSSCNNSNGASVLLVEKTEKLYRNMKTFVGQYEKQYNYSFNLSLYGGPIVNDKFVFNKMVSSETIFNERYDLLLKEVAQIEGHLEISEWLLSGFAELKRIDYEKIPLITSTLATIEDFYWRVTRWNMKQCHLVDLAKKKEYDIFGFVDAKTVPPEFDIKKTEAESRENKLKSLLPANISNYFFELRVEKNNFSCIKTEETYSIVLKFLKQELATQQLIINAVERYWNFDPRFKIKVLFIENNKKYDTSSLDVIRLENQGRGASFYKRKSDGSDLISLDVDDVKDEYLLKKIFAHELGHLLGFNDCYVEYYNEKSKEIIYYEMDDENLMCSINGLISSGHIKKILDRHCF